MPSLFVCLLSAIAIGLVAGGLVSFVDTHCFPDLVYDNMGYSLLEIFRLLPLCVLSIISGCMIGMLFGRRAKAAGRVGFVGSGLSTILLLLAARSEFASTMSDLPFSWRIRETFFAWGIYTLWAIAISLWGVVLLLRAGRRPGILTNKREDADVGDWPPPPSGP